RQGKGGRSHCAGDRLAGWLLSPEPAGPGGAVGCAARGAGRRCGDLLHVRVRQAVHRLRPRLGQGSAQGGLALPQGGDPDDCLCVRLRDRDGTLPVDDRQDPRVGVLRPDPGVEEVMSEIENAAAEGQPEIPGVAAKAANPDLRWYVVHAYSGMEKAVERNIKERINRAGM